jgi:DNA-binding HxlR family transcriptional regulator
MTMTETQPSNPIGRKHTTGECCSCAVPKAPGHARVAQIQRADDVFLQALLDVRCLLAAEWSLDILIVLQSSSLRYTELLDAVRSSRLIDRRTGRRRHPHTRTFIGTLRRMEAVGLINRSELEGVWPREVHYSLTPFARDLVRVLSPAVAWHEQHEVALPLGWQQGPPVQQRDRDQADTAQQ